MARKRREDHPGAWHHVFHRGARQEPIFLDDAHCTLMLDTVGDTVDRFRVEVHAYALMPNHYHVLMRCPLGNLSRSMRHLNATYTQRLNRVHGWDGPLFRGRFGSQLIGDEEYLEHLVAYIHLNPVRAHLVNRPDEPSWTSHRAYLGLEAAPTWLTMDEMLARFGDAAALDDYVRALQTGSEPWPEAMNTATGWLRQETVEAPPRRAAPRPATLRSPDEVERAVCRLSGARPETLRDVVRGPRANPPRRLAVWALSRAAGLTHSAIGARLGMSANQVAKVLDRMCRPGVDPQLVGWMEQWRLDDRAGPGA